MDDPKVDYNVESISATQPPAVRMHLQMARDMMMNMKGMTASMSR
jgi:hypothetical protein